MRRRISGVATLYGRFPATRQRPAVRPRGVVEVSASASHDRAACEIVARAQHVDELRIDFDRGEVGAARRAVRASARRCRRRSRGRGEGAGAPASAQLRDAPRCRACRRGSSAERLRGRSPAWRAARAEWTPRYSTLLQAINRDVAPAEEHRVAHRVETEIDAMADDRAAGVAGDCRSRIRECTGACPAE